MNKGLPNYGKSVRSKLLNVAKKEGVFFQTVLTRYFQERLLFRISQTSYRDNFYLKGGALMYAYEKFAARPTLDIDFLGVNVSNDEANIIRVFKEICSVPFEEDGVIYEVEQISARQITEFKDYHGVRISVPVKMDSITQVLTMDIGFGDIVTPCPVDLEYPLMLDHLPSPSILAYSVETVIAEKMHAAVDLADQNSRMKDYYDLYKILHSESYDVVILQDAVIHTFENRHTPYVGDTAFFREDFNKNSQMEVRWKAFLKKIGKDNDVTFKDAVEYIQEKLRPFWIELGNAK